MIDTGKLFAIARRLKGSGLSQAEVDEINAALAGEAGGIMRTSPKGIALIKAFEGLRLKAYPDPATGADPWTIGVGHTGDVHPGMVITEAQADELLRADLARFEDGIRKMCPIASQCEFDALVSLSFNIGLSNFKDSTLRRLHNEGDHEGAAAQFKRWDRAAGKVMAGLARRRAAESQLYRGMT